MLAKPGARLLGRALAAAVVIGTAAIAAACGGASEPAGATDAGPVHIHGLGINPADESLFIATHTGMFRLAPDSEAPRRVDDRHQDTMGFTVVGPDHFLGSGHPDLRDDLPPLLGLIESTDAGRSWRPVSLLGTADFHTLRAAGPRVLGYDATGGRVMSSVDGGRTWTTTRPPSDLADIVADPGAPRRLIAAGAAGIVTSADGGATWSRSPQPAVALAWPRRDRAYALEPRGGVSISADRGETWQPIGSVPGQPAALTAVDADTLIVALHDGGLFNSDDGGRTWSPGAWSEP